MSTPIRLPKLDQDMVEGHVLEWLVQDGDEVHDGDPVVVIETDKVSTELTAEASGVVRIVVTAGQSAPVGGELGTIWRNAEDSAGAEAASGVPDGEQAQATAGERFAAAAALVTPPEGSRPRLPLDRSSWQRPHELSPRRRAALAAEDSAVVLSAPAQLAVAAESAATEPTAAPTQRALVQMVERSWSVPQFAISASVPAGQILDLVRAFRERDLARLSVTHVLLKLVAAACRDEPVLNAHYLDGRRVGGDSLDVNVLVEAGDDLYNPCVFGVADKPLGRIAEETRALVERARARSLTREDLRSGSITLSNLGMYDVDDFTPLLYPPQVAILGTGRIDEAGTFRATLVADHRAVNGAQAARWLARFKNLCIDPAQLL